MNLIQTFIKLFLFIYSMIIPVRCFSCGTVIGSKWEDYQKLLEDGKTVKDALDELGLERFCCRSAMMSHVNSIEIVGKYK